MSFTEAPNAPKLTIFHSFEEAFAQDAKSTLVYAENLLFFDPPMFEEASLTGTIWPCSVLADTSFPRMDSGSPLNLRKH
jgi:hypothetical protein